MKYKAEIELELTIPSMNFIYRPGKNKKYPYLYKDPRVEEFQDELLRKLPTTSLRDLQGNASAVLHVHFIFKFSKRFWGRDTSNMFKATEDALVTFLGIDDSRTIKIIGEKKKLRKNQTKECIVIKIKVVENPYAT
jgi:Holliday junction resolvase RusA-like endonuclease